MESHIKYIASLFGVEAKNITREKFGFLCKTDQGVVVVQKNPATEENMESVLFQHEVKEHLHQSGFVNACRFLLTKENLPYHRTGGDFFAVLTASTAPPADFTNKNQLLAVVESLGRMHKILAGVKFNHKPKRQQDLMLPEKDLSSLTSYKKKLMKAGKFSEFDMLFLKAYEKSAPHISAWASIPKDVLGNNNYICHNLLKEENIHMEEVPFFTNFFGCCYGHYLSDLVYIIKRYLKAEPQGDLPLADIFDAYKKGHPEADMEQDFFAAKLLYPNKLIKVAKDYYSKNHRFVPKAYLSRMEESLERVVALEEYLQAQK